VGPGQSGDTTGIWYISIFGEAPRKLRDDAGRSAVSPDGKQIAFVSGRKEAEIWMMGSNGEEPKRVAEAGADGRFLQLQWSPDGKRIAFMKSIGPAGAQKISLEATDPLNGTNAQIFSSPGLQSFCWTSDGQLFLALQDAPPNERDTNLWQAPVRSTGDLAAAPHQVTKWAGFSFWDLSATADGARLAFVKSGSQADVYVGDLALRGGKFPDMRRLTLNEHNDWPSAWASDGSVLFYSDRNGHFDIFRQKPGNQQAEQVFSSAEDKLKPEFSADGKWLLFWQSDSRPNEHAKRLMKMSVDGGALSPLIEAQPGAEFHCARSKPFCVLAEPQAGNKQAIFSRFEISGGEKAPLASLPWSGTGDLVWNLSNDASVIALADNHENGVTLRTITLPSNKTREYELKDITVSGIAASASGWLLTSSSLRGNELLRLSADGHAAPLWSSSSPLSAPIVSRDDHIVALGLLSQDSNAWLLEQK
jgi:Tol biopolymer transport system component